MVKTNYYGLYLCRSSRMKYTGERQYIYGKDTVNPDDFLIEMKFNAGHRHEVGIPIKERRYL